MSEITNQKQHIPSQRQTEFNKNFIEEGDSAQTEQKLGILVLTDEEIIIHGAVQNMNEQDLEKQDALFLDFEDASEYDNALAEKREEFSSFEVYSC
ncbi:hypothetical protein PP175_25425 (plasmid) [Aneurinibacillus sp. Ricciae_BoGa-3]|uniref:hypothetical protein n=1 Tax=Aneurinibacillus sp. Ricciae_BoGa-3 TaxID=3022697 RepID=UPI002341AB1B|nr:hypothetical protein [Aneurinibacillus sp. Ricciae_BoGa-3]WCK57411.1 hypothetical protein PP175_25425 [Aneurinibacillus sp. Ricciae_BoGa-3]